MFIFNVDQSVKTIVTDEKGLEVCGVMAQICIPRCQFHIYSELNLVGHFLSGMNTNYLKGFQICFASHLTTLSQGKKQKNNSNQTNCEFALENTQGVLLLPQVNTHTCFFLINGRLCSGSAYCKQAQLLEKSITLNRKKY